MDKALSLFPKTKGGKTLWDKYSWVDEEAELEKS